MIRPTNTKFLETPNLIFPYQETCTLYGYRRSREDDIFQVVYEIPSQDYTKDGICEILLEEQNEERAKEIVLALIKAHSLGMLERYEE